MRHLAVEWVHRGPHYPQWIIAELGEDEFERRKTEVFPGGQIGYADSNEKSGGTYPATAPWPTTQQLRSDSEFRGHRIGQDVFEQAWEKRQNTTDLQQCLGGIR